MDTIWEDTGLFFPVVIAVAAIMLVHIGQDSANSDVASQLNDGNLSKNLYAA